MFSYKKIVATSQRYYLKGENPKLLIVSGTHGDEPDTVPIVEEIVERSHDQLPDFLYVPEISPSALKLGTRRNVNGIDVNRSFYAGVNDEEVRQLMSLWSNYSFDLFLTFHEDPTNSEFYLYDGTIEENREGRHLEGTQRLYLLRQDVLSAGVPLFNGVDDPDDPGLGFKAKDGYIHWPMEYNDHSADYWLLVETKRARQVINQEIPGLISKDKKAQIVNSIFKRLVIEKID